MGIRLQKEVDKSIFVDAIPVQNREKVFSIKDLYPQAVKAFVTDQRTMDANFAFLTTTLAKLHTEVYEPKYNTTYGFDVPIDYGGGFVDYISYYTVDWSGIMNEFRNVYSNNANYIPRVNAGLSQKKANVYTWQVAFDLDFIELEKMKKLTISKSIKQIYEDIITAGWDLFCQKVAYTGMPTSYGLFNNPNVLVTTIDNTAIEATKKGFDGLDDTVVVSFFNGIFELCLTETGMNYDFIPDTILVPSFVGSDLVSRYSALYTSTLYDFLLEHSLASSFNKGKKVNINFEIRPALDTLGTTNKGRIVAYRKNKSYVRMDMPYPIQHFITLPNIKDMCYTSAFVGQVSEIQMPYNDSNPGEFGPVTYWDFVK